jgi:hypothetical protein
MARSRAASDIVSLRLRRSGVKDIRAIFFYSKDGNRGAEAAFPRTIILPVPPILLKQKNLHICFFHYFSLASFLVRT